MTKLAFSNKPQGSYRTIVAMCRWLMDYLKLAVYLLRVSLGIAIGVDENRYLIEAFTIGPTDGFPKSSLLVIRSSPLRQNSR
jgi:hypothetical protein